MRNDDSKPLNIDLDQYTDGDVEFKQELVSLMISDLHDIQKSLENAGLLKNPQVFLRGYHKAKTTVVLLNDKELTSVLEELRMHAEKDKSNGAVWSEEKILLFHKLSRDLIKSLSEIHP